MYDRRGQSWLGRLEESTLFRIAAATAVALTLVTGLLAMGGVFREDTVALGTTLDFSVLAASRPAAEQFNRTVSDGDTVQLALVVVNSDDAIAGTTARDVRLRVTVPKDTGTVITVTSKLLAENAQDNPRSLEDKVVLASANNRPFNLSCIRNVQLQRNDVAPTNAPRFDWEPLEDVSTAQMKTLHTHAAFVFEIVPAMGR